MGGVSTKQLRQLLTALTEAPDVDEIAVARDDAERIDRVRLFEELKAAVCAAQALEAVAFDRSQRAAQAVAGQRASALGRGVAAQLALAKRTSPWAAQRWLGQAKILTAELPATFAELKAGRTSEWRALLVARETAVLTREDRGVVDVEVAGRLEGWGDGQVEREARLAAYRIDPHAVVARSRRAVADRGVSLRPADDTMCRLTALLPLADGVGVYAALSRYADLHVGHGDEPRGRGQVMADELVHRLRHHAATTTNTASATEADTDATEADTDATGSINATDATGSSDASDASDASGSIDATGSTDVSGASGSADGVGVEIQLIMTDQSLLNAGPRRNEPALLTAKGLTPIPIPAAIARDLALNANSRDGTIGRRWLRRLYTKPGTTQLVAMESPSRVFTTGQQRFLRTRDQICRTPWCNAAIRHADHVKRHTDGGPTSIGNGDGLCETCNHAKEAPGWRATVDHDVDGDGVITTTTPTGHHYDSRPPELPAASPVELYFAARLREFAA